MSRKPLAIQAPYHDGATNVALDTLAQNKQALVFVSTKRSAESQAEKIAHKVHLAKDAWTLLAEQALKALPSPTKQCKRLALCLRKGIAFHHAGLHVKQRTLIEDAFRKGDIGIICCTPTLAYGLNLPAFRTIVRDLKRFGARGMASIPVLEYHQYIGRSGRPDFHDTYGEALTLASTEDEEELIVEGYIKANPEQIFSKLAVEPVLRMYVLSLVATDIVKDRAGLISFFSKTLYGHHYADVQKLGAILDKIIGLLQQWEFLEGKPQDDFVSADALDDTTNLRATRLGKRVSELYLDPYTANHLLVQLEQADEQTRIHPFALLFMLSGCLEIRPLLRVRNSDLPIVEEALNRQANALLQKEPSPYSEEYDEYLDMFKTAMFLQDWIDEAQEEPLLEKYGIRPGEIHVKLERLDWLCFGATELARIKGWKGLTPHLHRLRTRLKYGVREELLPLLRLKGVGRVRARQLFVHKMRSLGDVQKADVMSLVQLLGKKLAIDVKKQVGQRVDSEHVRVKPRKRKGQINLGDFGQ